VTGTPAHDHPHEHPHEHPHAEPEAGTPPPAGPVVLDIGDGVGALVVHLPDDRAGTELHLRAEGRPPIHTGVWPRPTGRGTPVVAVFGELAEGSWAILDDHGRAVRDVVVAGGRVTEVDLR
jgi:hypothetical protein